MYREVWRLSFPAILTNLLFTFQMIADTFMLGRYPPADISLSALGLGFLLYHMFFPLMMGLITATVAIIARRWGEGRRKEAERAASDSLVILLLLSLPISVVIFLWSPHLLFLLGARGMVITEGTNYVRGMFAFYPFATFFHAYQGFQRAAGDTKTPMYVALVANVYNVVMNYLLIFGKFGFPELGVLGAGIATGTSYLVGSLVYGLLQGRGSLLVSPMYRHRRPRLPVVRKMFRIGIPAGIDRGMWALSAVFITPLILYFGTVGYSAYQIGLRAESIAYMPAVGFGVAATTLAGQYLGRGSGKGAEAAVRAATVLCLVTMTVIGAMMVLVPAYIARVFTSSPEVIGLAAIYLFLMGFSEPALGAVFTLGGGMRGAGYTKVPMAVNFFGLIVLRLSLGYALGIGMGMGLPGVWLGMVIEWFVRLVLMYAFFVRGRWKAVKV